MSQPRFSALASCPRSLSDYARFLAVFLAIPPEEVSQNSALISVRSRESTHTSHLRVSDVSFDVSFVLHSARAELGQGPLKRLSLSLCFVKCSTSRRAGVSRR